MLVPVPSLPTQIGPPTEFARRLSIWIAFCLLLQISVCVLRIVAFLDIMGGFMMGFMIGLGCYGWKMDCNITFMSSWGALCLVNGTFDLARCIDLAVHSPRPFFLKTATVMYNLGSAVLIAVPVVCYMGAILAWLLYKDFAAMDIAGPGGEGAAPFNNNDPLGNYREGQPPLGLAGHRGSLRAEPFSGEGHRLGATMDDNIAPETVAPQAPQNQAAAAH